MTWMIVAISLYVLGAVWSVFLFFETSPSLKHTITAAVLWPVLSAFFAVMYPLIWIEEVMAGAWRRWMRGKRTDQDGGPDQ